MSVAGSPARLYIASLALALGQPASAEPGPALRLADAQKLADRALQAARVIGRDVSIVVVNREARVILSLRMDNASFLSLSLAEAKASTAAAIGVPTALLEKQVDSGKPSLLSAAGVAMIAGGSPVLQARKLVGGIGVSGGSSEEDEAIATAALSETTTDGSR